MMLSAKLKKLVEALDSKLEKLLKPYDKCRLECDGLTRVLHTVLSKNKIKHSVHQGEVHVGKEVFNPHFWIQLPNGYVVDYRLRMWFGNKAPHGIFKPENNDVKYDGDKINMPELSDVMFQILVDN